MKILLTIFFIFATAHISFANDYEDRSKDVNLKIANDPGYIVLKGPCDSQRGPNTQAGFKDPCDKIALDSQLYNGDGDLTPRNKQAVEKGNATF